MSVLEAVGQRVAKIDRSILLLLPAVIAVIVLVAYPMFWLGFGAVHNIEREFTTDPAFTLLTRPRTYSILWRTVHVALVATAISAVIAIPMAWATARTDMPFRRTVRVLVVIGFITPPFLLGFAYILMFGPRSGLITTALQDIGIPTFNLFSYTGLVLTIAAHAYVYIFITVSTALSRLDPEMEDAARLHGASVPRTAMTVTLPLVMPAILSGALLSFIIGLNVFGIHAIIGLPANMRLATTEIFSLFSFPIRFTEAAVWGWLLFAVAGVAMFINQRVVRKRSYVTVRGKGIRPDIIALGRWRWLALLFCAAVLAFTLVVPVFLVGLVSFLDVWGRGPVAGNFTLESWQYITTNELVRESVVNSTWLATVSATIMVVLAGLMAWVVVRTNLPGRNLLRVSAVIPLTIPGIVLAVGLIWAFINPPIVLFGTFAILIFAYVAKFYPIALEMASTSLGQIDPELEQAGRVHGGSFARVFRQVTVPLIGPGLIAAWMMVFIQAARELAASVLLFSSGRTVISVVMFELWQEGHFEYLAAFSALLMLLILAGYLILRRVSGRDLI